MAAGKQPSGLSLERGRGLVGQTIGDFEILEEIGRGGMGVVFKTRQVSLDRMVALKILSYALGLTDHAVARFQREAQATAKLNHPNIIPIYAQGQQEQTYYYAMELVSGRSLYDIIKELRGDGAAARVAESPVDSVGGSSVAADLALAETELIVPASGSASSRAPGGSNGSDDDTSGSARRSGTQYDPRFDGYDEAYFDDIARQIRDVADALEYAHHHGVIHRDIKPHNLLVGHGGRLCLTDFGLARVLAQPGMTQTGEFVGSPLYMAPEQLTGAGNTGSVTTDIYSLGATLYEWLTLCPPFPAATREQVISQIITSEVVPPRARNRRVPLDLETICTKALDKDPSRRYQSAADLRDDLNRFLNRARIKAQRTSIWTNVARVLSRRRTAAVLAFAIVIITALFSLLLRERRNARNREIALLMQATPAPQGRVTTITDASPGPAPSPPVSTEANIIASRMQQGEQLARMLGGESLLSGLLATQDKHAYTPATSAQRLGAAYLMKARMQEAERLDALARGEMPADPADAHFLGALAAPTAVEALADLDELSRSAPERRDAGLLRAWLLCLLDRIDEMQAQAEAIVAKYEGDPEALLARGAARLLLQHYAEAQDDIAEAGKVLEGDYRIDEIAGLLHIAHRESDRALAAFGRALTLNPDSILARMHRAELNLSDGHAAPALADLTHVVALEPRNAEALELRGACYDKLKRFDEAARDYLRAYEISSRGALLIKAGAAVLNRDDPERIARDAAQPDAREGSESGTLRNQDRVPQQAVPQEPGSVHHWWRGFLDGVRPPRTRSPWNGSAPFARSLR